MKTRDEMIKLIDEAREARVEVAYKEQLVLIEDLILLDARSEHPRGHARTSIPESEYQSSVASYRFHDLVWYLSRKGYRVQYGCLISAKRQREILVHWSDV